MSYLGFCPPGVVMPFAGTTAPDGWLLCDGSDIPKTTYANLFAVISNLYDTQVNSTTGSAYAAPASDKFRLPDYRGLFLRGAGTAFGKDPVSLGIQQEEKTKNPANAFTTAATSGSGSTGNNTTYTDFNWQDYSWEGLGVKSGFAGGRVDSGAGGLPNNLGSFGGTHTHSFSVTTTASSVNGGGDNETRPINKGVNYIIKF